MQFKVESYDARSWFVATNNPAVKSPVRGLVPMATPVYNGNQTRVGQCRESQGIVWIDCRFSDINNHLFGFFVKLEKLPITWDTLSAKQNVSYQLYRKLQELSGQCKDLPPWYSQPLEAPCDVSGVWIQHLLSLSLFILIIIKPPVINPLFLPLPRSMFPFPEQRC